METLRELNNKKIMNAFINISRTIELENHRGLTDLNKKMEDFLIFIFDNIFCTKLINANNDKSNYPAIDLYDLNERIAIQVTSTDSMAKKRDTYNLFYEHKLYKKFDELHIFILKFNGNLSKKNLNTRVETYISIMDFKSLYKDISISSDEKISNILDYIEKELIIDTNSSIKFLIPDKIIITKETISKFIYNSGHFLGGENEEEDINNTVVTYNNLFNIFNNLSSGSKNLLVAIINHSIDKFSKINHLNTLLEGCCINLSTLRNRYSEGYIHYVNELVEAQIAFYDPESPYLMTGYNQDSLSIYYRGQLVDGNAFAILYDYLDYCPDRLKKVLVDLDFSELS